MTKNEIWTKFENDESTAMKVENLESLVGKTIAWRAPIYDANIGFYCYGWDGGICTIKSVDLSKSRPIVAEGSDNEEECFLNYAFQSEYEDGYIAYSDEDRYVHFIVLD